MNAADIIHQIKRKKDTWSRKHGNTMKPCIQNSLNHSDCLVVRVPHDDHNLNKIHNSVATVRNNCAASAVCLHTLVKKTQNNLSAIHAVMKYALARATRTTIHAKPHVMTELYRVRFQFQLAKGHLSGSHYPFFPRHINIIPKPEGHNAAPAAIPQGT
jgi:hypothetical protein